MNKYYIYAGYMWFLFNYRIFIGLYSSLGYTAL